MEEKVTNGFMPSWLNKGSTALLQKEKSERNIGSNCRPLTYLPLMWKLLTGLIADQIYGHFDHQKNRKDAGKDLEELMIYFTLIGQ